MSTHRGLAPPGSKIPLEILIPPAIDHQHDWVFIEQALNTGLRFEPPY